MKLPAFNNERKEWDTYKQFHVSHGSGSGYRYGSKPFVQFESGEFLVRKVKFSPHERKEYESLGIAVTFTTTTDYKFALPDGTPVPNAWVTHNGGQSLLVDLVRQRAYKLHYTFNRQGRASQVPAFARSAAIYFANPDADPVCAPIEVARPDDKFKQESRDWMNDLRATCKSIARIRNLNFYYQAKYRVPKHLVGKPIEDVLTTMPDVDIYRIAELGFAYDRAVSEVPYLDVIYAGA